MKANFPIVPALLGLVLLVPVATAGEIDLAWERVSDADVVGYTLYWDTQPGPPYANQVPLTLAQVQQIGSEVRASLGNLPDCVELFVAVKARDADGAVSDDYSNVVQGHTHPSISGLSPNVVDPGGAASVVVSGSGFKASARPTDFPGTSGLTIDSYTVDSCSRMTMQVSVAAGASGSHALEIVNTDEQTFDLLPNALQVRPDICAVVGVSPAAGTDGVDPKPTVRVDFSCPLDPARVNSKRVRLNRLGPPGRSKGKAKASTRLEPGNMAVTLVLSDALEAGQAYGLSVKGGKKGVRFMDESTLAQTYSQSPTFVTQDVVSGVFYGPDAGSATSPLSPGAQIPPGSVVVVRFTEPLSASSVTKKTFKLKQAGKGSVSLQGRWPQVSQDGLSVVLEGMGGSLPAGANLTLKVKGGKKGLMTLRGIKRAESMLLSFTTSVGQVPSLGVAE